MEDQKPPGKAVTSIELVSFSAFEATNSANYHELNSWKFVEIVAETPSNL